MSRHRLTGLPSISPQAYWRHKIGNALQTVLLFGAMVGVLYLISRLFGGGWFLIALIMAFFFPLLLSKNMAPHWVMKLYRARLLERYQFPLGVDILHDLSRRAHINSPALYLIDSTQLNAFSVGQKNNSAIAITSGLLRRLTEPELEAVFAHELSHISKNDLWVMNLANGISQLVSVMSNVGVILLLLNIPLFLLGEAQFPWSVLIVLILAPTIVQLMQLALSRSREFNADLTACSMTHDPYNLAMALKKIEQGSTGVLSQFFQPRNAEAPTWLRTHPATEERIARLMSLYEQNSHDA